MARKLPLFFLADLMAVIAIAGLVLGLPHSSDSPANVFGIFSLIVLVVFAWTFFRALRNAPTCDECGRRFIAPVKKPAAPPACPNCGELHLGRARSRKILAISFWAALAALVLGVVLITIDPLAGSSLPSGSRIIFYFWWMIGMMLVGSLMVVLLIALFMHDSARFKPVACEKCGAGIPTDGTTVPQICPQCRVRNLSRKQVKSTAAKGYLIMLALLSSLGILVSFLRGNFAGPSFGVRNGISLLLDIVATIVGVVGVFVVVFVVGFFLRARRLKCEPYVLKRARQCAGEEGEVVRSGATTVLYTGPTNPAPLLMAQIESTHGRLEELMGREVGNPPFLRILCFQKRRAFEAFVGPFTALITHYMKTQSGFYFPQPHRILAICDEELPHHVRDPDGTARTLLGSYFMEALPGNPLASWVRVGISGHLAATDDDPIPLNRKLFASLSRGKVLGTRLFEINDEEVLNLIKRWEDHHSFEKVLQFVYESCSVFEYLGGKLAPEERRERLRALLADTQAKAQPAMVFERHFGFGLDRLVESWREWVQEQGIGTFTLPPPHIAEQLLNRLIPLIENCQANREDRILAIRRMGSMGYILRADALIGLLRNHDDAIPKEEVTWALEAISGMAYGDDPGRWTAWWNTIPSEVRDRRHFSLFVLE